MSPDQAVDNREQGLDEYDRIIDRIMEDEKVDFHEAERRYSRTRELYLQWPETDGCDA